MGKIEFLAMLSYLFDINNHDVRLGVPTLHHEFQTASDSDTVMDVVGSGWLHESQASK